MVVNQPQVVVRRTVHHVSFDRLLQVRFGLFQLALIEEPQRVIVLLLGRFGVEGMFGRARMRLAAGQRGRENDEDEVQRCSHCPSGDFSRGE